MSQAAQVSMGGQPDTNQEDEVSQFLSFRLTDKVYAVELLSLREIVDYGNLTAVPMMQDFIRGVINLRGSVVPVVDLAVRLGGQAVDITKRTSIIIVEIIDESEDEKMNIGIIVDGVNEVLDIKKDNIEPPPGFGAKIRTDFIMGMGKVDGKFLVLLDVGNVLSIDELSMLNEVRTGVDKSAG